MQTRLEMFMEVTGVAPCSRPGFGAQTVGTELAAAATPRAFPGKLGWEAPRGALVLVSQEVNEAHSPGFTLSAAAAWTGAATPGDIPWCHLCVH